MRRNGFTLVEMLVVVGLVSIIVLFGWPRIRGALAGASVHGARNVVAGAYARGRTVAQQTGRAVTLRIAGNQVRVEASPRLDGLAGADTVVPVQDLNSQFGVTVTAGQSAFGIDPRGLSGTSGTISFARSGRTDSVYISGYGRLQ